MKKKNKIPAEVLEQLEEQHPQMAKAVKRQMDAEGRIEVRDEVVLMKTPGRIPAFLPDKPVEKIVQVMAYTCK